MRLALVATSSADDSLPARSTRRLVQNWRAHGEIECFVGGSQELAFDEQSAARPVDTLQPARYDQVLFSVSDDPAYAFIPRALRALGGCALLYQWSLWHMARAAWSALDSRGWRGRVLRWREGARMVEPYPGSAGGRTQPTCNRSIVRMADSFLVHSQDLRSRILDERNAPTPIAVLPACADAMPAAKPDRPTLRAALGLDPSWSTAFLVSSIAPLASSARMATALDAIARARKARADIKLLWIGTGVAAEYEARGLLAQRGLEAHVKWIDASDRAGCWPWLQAADLGLQLRGTHAHATSDAVMHQLRAGRGVVASAWGEQAELPDECVFKLVPDAMELERLSSRLVELHDAVSVRQAMEAAARAVAARIPTPDEQARWAWEALEAFPRHRSARKSLFAMRLTSAARAGYRRGLDAREELPNKSFKR